MKSQQLVRNGYVLPCCLLLLGAMIFWLYYRIYILGPESVLPAAWQNPR